MLVSSTAFGVLKINFYSSFYSNPVEVRVGDFNFILRPVTVLNPDPHVDYVCVSLSLTG